MLDLSFFINIGLALALGALIGIEREKTKQQKHGVSLAGIRTMILVSLLGAITAFLGKTYGNLIFFITFAAVALLTIISHVFFVFKKHLVGITTEVSVLFVFLLGALTMTGYSKIAFVIGVIVALVLSLRKPIHTFINKLSPLEVLDTIKFALIAFVILPFLPNEPVDPWGLFNPYLIWLFVVIFSAISFLGYVLSKWIGEKKGINVTAFVAGLISSTAMVSTIGQRVVALRKNFSPYLMAAIIAYLASFIPTLFELFLLNIPLFFTVLPVMALVAFIGTIFVISIAYSKDFPKAELPAGPKLKSPFKLSSALEFGVLLLAIHTLAILGERHLGDAGIYITSAISGMASMDAITLSMAGLGGKSVPLAIAGRAILIGLSVSAVMKIILLGAFSRGKIVKRATPYFLILSALLVTCGFLLL